MSEVVNFDPSGEADGSLNSLATWERHTTSQPHLQLVGGVIEHPNAGSNVESTSQHTTAHNGDHYAEAEITSLEDGAYLGLICAGQSPTSDGNFYLGTLDVALVSGQYEGTVRVAKRVAGVYDGAIQQSPDLFPGSVIRLVRAGDTVTFFVNGNFRGSYTNSTGGQLAGGAPGILMRDGVNIGYTVFRSGNVLTSSNSVSATGTAMANQSDPANQAISPHPMNDSLGNPKFSSSGTITKYGAVNLPPGLTINNSTGVMSGTPTTQGTYGVHVWAEDDQGWQLGSTFSWTITAPETDTTAPTFTDGPAATSPTNGGHTITATLDESGTIYAVRLANGASAPSSAQVKAGQDAAGAAAPEANSTAATASTEASMVFSTGDRNTPYDYYVVAEDDEGSPNLQSNPTKVDATTLGPTIVLSEAPTPGATITATLTNFSPAPTQVVLTDTQGNTLTRSLTLVSGNDYTFTVPSLPASGTVASLLFGDTTVEATEGV